MRNIKIELMILDKPNTQQHTNEHTHTGYKSIMQ